MKETPTALKMREKMSEITDKELSDIYDSIDMRAKAGEHFLALASQKLTTKQRRRLYELGFALEEMTSDGCRSSEPGTGREAITWDLDEYERDALLYSKYRYA